MRKDTYDTLVAEVREQFGDDDVKFTDRIGSDLHADSLDMVALRVALEDAFDLPPDALVAAFEAAGRHNETVRELIVRIDDVRAAPDEAGVT